MNFLLFLGKSARQQARDPAGTLLTLLTTPVFTVLYGILMHARDSVSGGTAFDMYVPGLLVLSIIMIIFSSAMALARELESGAMQRVRLWPVSTFAVLGGTSAVQLVLAIVGTCLTLGCARLLGFRPAGSFVVVLGLATLAATASIGLGLVVASLAKTQSRAFLVASVLMFLLLLFSGVVFPRPSATFFHIDHTPVGPFDLLPTTHLHEALARTLSGAPLRDVMGRASVLSLLSLVYFTAGLALFRARHRVGARA
ncbi:MAG: ABC transporter permease [Polyangiaceae bacterium]